MRLTAVRNDESEAASFRHPLLEQVSAKKLRATVEALNYPRQYVVQAAANKRACKWICEELVLAG